MKQKINFLNELPKRKPDLFTVEMMLRFFAIFFAILLAFYVFDSFKNVRLSSEVDSLKAKEQEITSTIEALNRKYPEVAETVSASQTTEDLKKEIEQRSKVIAVIHKKKTINVTGFSGYLLGLSRAVPNDVWLKEVKIDNGGSQITLTGRALSSENVAKFIKNLTVDPAYKDKNFEIIKISKVTDKDKEIGLLDFSIGTHQFAEAPTS